VPAAQRQLGLDDARDLIATIGFGGDPGTDLIGVELESFTHPATDPESLELPALPGGCAITFEPGGQVELSSRPARSVGEVCEAVGLDLATLREAFSRQGVNLAQRGLTSRPPLRIVDGPRYRAMEAYFDAGGPVGRIMMCATASLQVNLGLGAGSDRWRRANMLGPVFAVAFSSSAGGRLAAWLALDPTRTAPVGTHGTPADAWADYALDARVMLIRADGDDFVPVTEPMRARDWVARGHSLGWPTADDLAYHLTTLFPPVRPRGWLEVRMIDALPDPWWRVPVAVVAAVLDDPELEAGCRPAGGRWREAADRGLDDPVLGHAARLCARAALDGLDRVGADPFTAGLVERWAGDIAAGRNVPWI
jgi:glutamate--cysteine ligase